MLFECWVLYLGLRTLALFLYSICFQLYYKQHPKQPAKKNRSKRKNVSTNVSAPSSADNTENELDTPEGRRGRNGYSNTISVTKRKFTLTEPSAIVEESNVPQSRNTTQSINSNIDNDNDDNSNNNNDNNESTASNSTAHNDEVLFDTGITHRQPTPITGDPTVDNDIAAIVKAVKHGELSNNNNNNNNNDLNFADTRNNNITINNNNNNNYNKPKSAYILYNSKNFSDDEESSSYGVVANKYGYYGKKSFATVPSSTKHKAEFTVGNVICDRHGESIDWNAHFQRLLQLPESNEVQKLDKYEQLSALSKDFLHVAVTFGRIIISEAYLDPSHRTIIPVSVGGQAGGVKYIYHGVMFKFACDWMNLYSGDANAMKAGGHELKSLMRYYGREGIHVPLMALIDFRGFRLVAMSILPIKGKDTLVYGSEDGGANVAASNADFNEKMRDIGTRLNLKGHMAGLGVGQERKFLNAPTDIEGHIGTDGLYYVIDFARTFPPTAGAGVSSEFLYKLFRPEFLQNYPIPLSSDAYSPFGGSGNNVHNQEVLEATEYLVTKLVPRFASWLEQSKNWVRESSDQLTEILHREGINVRYLGLVRKHVQKAEVKQFLLVEMVARVVKNSIRQKLRNKMKQLRTLEEGCYIRVVVDFFNAILGYHPVKSVKFWETKLPKDLNKQFEGSLSEYESFDFATCREKIDHYHLFRRVQTLSGIKLTAQALEDLKHDPRSFKVVLPDIETMEARVKHMNIVSLAEGNALALQCMRAPGSQRLFRLATDKFERAVRATPDISCIDVLNNYGEVLEKLAQKSGGKDCFKYLERSMQIYRSAQNYAAIIRLAKLLPQIAEVNFEDKNQLLLLAVKCYESVLEFTTIPDPEITKFTTMVRFVDLLIVLAKMNNSDIHYERAGELIAEANASRPKGHPRLFPEWTDKLANMEKTLVWEILIQNTPSKSYHISAPSYDSYVSSSTSSFSSSSSPSSSLSSTPAPSTISASSSSSARPALKVNTSSLAGAIGAKAFVYKGASSSSSSQSQSQSPSPNPTPSPPTTPTKGKGIRTSSDGFTFYTKKKGKEPSINTNNNNTKQLVSTQEQNNIPIVTPNASTQPTQIETNTLYKKTLLSTWLLDAIFTNWGPAIETLSLDSAHLDDTIVATMRFFERLTVLNFRKNRSVSDSLLFRLSPALSQLTHLTLAHTNVSDSSVSHLVMNCTNLHYVNLAGCGITDKVFDGDYARNIEIVNVSQSQANKICLTLAKYCHGLKELYASHLQLHDKDILELSRSCRGLAKLDISHTYVSDDGVRLIAQNLHRLTVLDLTACRYVTAKTVNILENVKESQIRELVLNKCGMVKLAGLSWTFPNLIRLEISQYFMANDSVIFGLGRCCPNLEKLVLAGCHSICTDVNGMIIMTRQCQRLNHLDLSETSCSDSTIAKVSNNLAGLTFLSLLKCNVGEEGALEISQNCTKLISLNLSGCPNVSDSSIVAISERCTSLTDLQLSNCVLLTDDAVSHIGSKLHNLINLDLSACLLITDLSPICKGSPMMKTLTLAGCENVSDMSASLVAELVHLKVLHIAGCKRITDTALSHFALQAPSLKRLFLGATKTSDSAVAELQQTRMDIEVIYRDSSATNPSQPQRALRSLMRDWKYIQDNPLPLISAAPLEHNMFIWHANVMGPENTPYWRGLFHIELKFPPTYPTTSPSATVLTPLPHPHVHANGKICLDMLSDFQGYFQSMDVGMKVKGTGWSSAYSVQTLLLQIQTFLMSVEPDEAAAENESLSYLRNIPQAIQQSLQFTCSSCSHAATTPWPPLPVDVPADVNQEKEVPEEEDSNLNRALRELMCFHTRVNFMEDVLGVGVIVKRLKNGSIETISCTLDLLSRSAFVDGVRTSVMGEEFTHWLPLYINEAHGGRAHDLVIKAISSICTGYENRFEPSMAVSVLSKLMNTMVVSLMSEQMHASIKALEGYCAFHRLLLLCVKDMNEKIENFVNKHAHRHKRYVAALGEFLPLLTVSKFQWKDVAQAYIEESFDRNVKWLLVKYPELEYMPDDPANNASRLSKTFTGNLVSIRLLLFHVHFLQQVARPNSQNDLNAVASTYDERFGQPPLHVKQALQSTVKDILRVHTWEDFFTRIGLPVPQPTELVRRLQQAVVNSAARGYHKPGVEKMHIIDRKCTSFFRNGYCKYDDSCKFSHSEERYGRRLSSSDHAPTHANLPPHHTLPRSSSSTSIGSDESSGSANSDYHYNSNNNNNNNSNNNNNLNGSSGMKSPRHRPRTPSSPHIFRSNSSLDGNYSSNYNNKSGYSNKDKNRANNNNWRGYNNDSSSNMSNDNNQRKPLSRSSSMRGSSSNSLSSSSSSSSSSSPSSSSGIRARSHTQTGYYDNSGLFIPHTSPPSKSSSSYSHSSSSISSSSSSSSSKPPLIPTSSWRGWSQPDPTKSKENQDVYMDTNFPSLHTATSSASNSTTTSVKSQNNSEDGDNIRRTADSALDGESDFSDNTTTKSDTMSIYDDFNFDPTQRDTDADAGDACVDAGNASVNAEDAGTSVEDIGESAYSDAVALIFNIRISGAQNGVSQNGNESAHNGHDLQDEVPNLDMENSEPAQNGIKKREKVVEVPPGVIESQSEELYSPDSEDKTPQTKEENQQAER